MRKLKKMMKNKAYIEGSIAEAYIIGEISTFCSYYFGSSVETCHNRVGRNDDVGNVELDDRLSIFSHPCRTFGETRSCYLSEEEYRQALLYAILSCDEVLPYVK